MDVHVTHDLTFVVDLDWEPACTELAGHLDDGRTVALVTLGDDVVTASVRADAIHQWLHGRVLVLDAPDRPPYLVVPVDRVGGAVVGEAVRRWLVGPATASAA